MDNSSVGDNSLGNRTFDNNRSSNTSVRIFVKHNI